MSDKQAERRKVGLIMIGASILTLAFAAVVFMGVLDLEPVRLEISGLLVFVALLDVVVAWRFYLTPRA